MKEVLEKVIDGFLLGLGFGFGYALANWIIGRF